MANQYAGRENLTQSIPAAAGGLQRGPQKSNRCCACTSQQLLDALVEDLAHWPDDVAKLEAGADDPRERLRLFLHWLLPCDEQGLKEETARVNLIGERDTRVRTEHLFAAWDQNVRSLLARHVEQLFPAERVPAIVDVLRSTTNGITLSTVEHPDQWPPERQFAVIDEVLTAFGLLPEKQGRPARSESTPG
jgi:hypothetical protein